MNREIEITAPVGSFESLAAARKGGADSVYFGVGALNMRSRSAKNFSVDDLLNIAEYCAEYDMKSYLALNVVVYDNELADMKRLASAAKESGIDAIIATDHAVIDFANRIDMPVHISTQVNISNVESLKFYAPHCETVVLARELSLERVAAISDAVKKDNIIGKSCKPLRLEIFAHGALCVAISGKCYLSLHEKAASANRGACMQLCRRSYIASDKESGEELEIDNEYILSPKDLCTIDFVDKIIEAGVGVLKIEGRGRPPEYVRTTAECYREAVDSVLDGTFSLEKVKDWRKRLATVYNRGFWDGYYLGRRLGEWSGRYGSSATEKKAYSGRVTNYYSKLKVASIIVENNEFEVGDRLLFTGPTTGAEYLKVEEIRLDDKAVGKASRGAEVSVPATFRVRRSDRVYKIIPAGKVRDAQ